jgi:hypothetical protein
MHSMTYGFAQMTPDTVCLAQKVVEPAAAGEENLSNNLACGLNEHALAHFSVACSDKVKCLLLTIRGSGTGNRYTR